MGFFSFRESAPPDPRTLPAVPEEVLERIQPLIHRQKIQAIKELRGATRLDLKTAKDIVDCLAAGAEVPVIDARPALSLADRARELRAEGRPAAAINLVATETGMTETEAARFLDCLD